jgi:hypothetical protein
MTEVARYQFYFNSTNAVLDVSQDSSCFFKVYLNRILSLTNPDNQFYLAVEKVTIPNCFKQFTSSNSSSTLGYAIYVSGSPVYTGSISIPNGNYSVSDMGSIVATLLPADIIANVPSITSCSITWVYNKNTNRFSMQLFGSLYGGLSWELVLSDCAITKALGFYNFNAQEAVSLTVNGASVQGFYNVNMNPVPEIYVVSNQLTDTNAVQCFPVDEFSVKTLITGIVAVVHLDHPASFYVYKDFVNPIKIPLDRTSIDMMDFDLRTYNNEPLYDLDQPWYITFSIVEMNMDTVRAQQLRTYINSIPPSIDQVNFLERNRINEETSQTLETLRQKLTNSLEQLRSNVQKRKSPSPVTTTLLESTTGTNSTTASGPTPSSANAGEAEQTSIDIDGSAKRQRQSQEIPENINS